MIKRAYENYYRDIVQVLTVQKKYYNVVQKQS